jgi:hypothetical protein
MLTCMSSSAVLHSSMLHSSMRLPLVAAAALFITLPAASQAFTASPAKPTEITPATHITVPENTLIRVRTDKPLNTHNAKEGMPLLFTLSEDVIVDTVHLIPRGAVIHGEVIRNQRAGTLGGTPELTLRLDSLELAGITYPLYSYQFRVVGETKEKPSPTAVVGTAELGAIIAGTYVNGQPNATPANVTEAASAGAVIGAGAVVAAKALQPKPIIKIPAEAQLDFYLAAPMSIQPVSVNEAARLAQRLNSAGPVLYIHGETP